MDDRLKKRLCVRWDQEMCSGLIFRISVILTLVACLSSIVDIPRHVVRLCIYRISLSSCARHWHMRLALCAYSDLRVDGWISPRPPIREIGRSIAAFPTFASSGFVRTSVHFFTTRVAISGQELAASSTLSYLSDFSRISMRLQRHDTAL